MRAWLRKMFLNTQPQNDVQVYLIAGLGNPGREHRKNRHNIGFMVVDQVAKKMGISLSRMQSRAMLGQGFWEGRKVILVKPLTFMNLSGQAICSLLKFYKVPAANLMVVHDDIDLSTGTLRLRPGGGSAGQKGVASIIERLGDSNFARLRFGVGRPPGRMEAADYVLHDFDAAELDVVNIAIDRAAVAIGVFISAGLEAAMNQYNGSSVKE